MLLRSSSIYDCLWTSPNRHQDTVTYSPHRFVHRVLSGTVTRARAVVVADFESLQGSRTCGAGDRWARQFSTPGRKTMNAVILQSERCPNSMMKLYRCSLSFLDGGLFASPRPSRFDGCMSTGGLGRLQNNGDSADSHGAWSPTHGTGRRCYRTMAMGCTARCRSPIHRTVNRRSNLGLL